MRNVPRNILSGTPISLSIKSTSIHPLFQIHGVELSGLGGGKVGGRTLSQERGLRVAALSDRTY